MNPASDGNIEVERRHKWLTRTAAAAATAEYGDSS